MASFVDLGRVLLAISLTMTEIDTHSRHQPAELSLVERFCGGMLGLACGDAVGTTLEFSKRGSFSPLTDMIGGGPFQLKAGEWTDDTSMALCLAESLVRCPEFDPRDQMIRYLNWYRYGYMSSTGACFDIGNTTSQALRNFEQTQEPFSGSTSEQFAGNGSLMRLLPVVLSYFPRLDQIRHYAKASSRTTHGAAECLDACQVFGEFLFRALLAQSKEQILFGSAPVAETSKIRAIAGGAYRDKELSQILGTGYVVDSLEAALYCFWKTTSFREAVLMAANLGDDADSTAAVCGQIAGLYYGLPGIPAEWQAKIVLKDEILALAKKLGVFAETE